MDVLTYPTISQLGLMKSAGLSFPLSFTLPKLKILHYLGEHGPANKYRIRKESGAGSQPTVLAAVDELEKSSEIESHKTITHARGGQPSKLYDLTLYGLAELISNLTSKNPIGNVRENIGLLDRLARKYRDLMPDLFDQLWPALREVGAHRDSELGMFCGLLSSMYRRGLNKKGVTNYIRDTGVTWLLGVGPGFREDDPSIIREEVRSFRGNTVLRKATMKQLTDAANALREEARNYAEWAKEYEKLAKWFAKAD
jgi:DNA-binding PadR family transcriptional regulator